MQKNYNINCAESEVSQLQECTDFVNNILYHISKNCKTTSENTLMAMALLTITDELLDNKKRLQEALLQKKDANEKIQDIKSEPIIPQAIVTKLENLYEKMNNHNETLL